MCEPINVSKFCFVIKNYLNIWEFRNNLVAYGWFSETPTEIKCIGNYKYYHQFKLRTVVLDLIWYVVNVKSVHM